MYSFTLFSSYLVFTTLLLPFLPENIHLCKSVNLVFRAHFTETRWNILFILVFLSCNLFSKSNCGSFLTFSTPFVWFYWMNSRLNGLWIWLLFSVHFSSFVTLLKIYSSTISRPLWFHKALYFYLTSIFTQQKKRAVFAANLEKFTVAIFPGFLGAFGFKVWICMIFIL